MESYTGKGCARKRKGREGQGGMRKGKESAWDVIGGFDVGWKRARG
jgi:hypothetical protein